jgi:hypothetical protein
METNPRYFPPLPANESEASYVQQYIAEGIYPPKLTLTERRYVDRIGKQDKNGNIYEVVWTLGGHPLAAKRNRKGAIFIYSNQHRRYKRNIGCFGIEFL